MPTYGLVRMLVNVKAGRTSLRPAPDTARP